MGTITRTVVFTDLANYTAKVARSDREGLRRILQEHEQLVTPVVNRYGGRVVKNLGDAFLILFQSATDGLRASLDIQNHVMSTGGMPLRLSLATGDVEEIDGDAFGEAVNLSARINSKAPAGEIWFSHGTHICMNAAEIPWESVGRFRLKGIPGDQEVYRAVPQHKAWLPESVQNAAKAGTLVRLRRGARPPMLPPDPVVLFEGFQAGSPALETAIDALPVLNPSSLWLATYNIAQMDRMQWTESGRGLVVGQPEAIDAAIQDTLKVQARTSGSDTIVLDVGSSADLELVMSGLALPAVPLSDVVSSYFYDLLLDGRWVNGSDRSVVRIEVDANGPRLVAMANGVTVNGAPLGSGGEVALSGGDVFALPNGHEHRVYDGGHGYAALIVSDTEMRLGVATGQTAELGREPNHPGLAFPDRRGQDNIRWCSGARAARARAGGFTLDRALAGRRQAAVQVLGDSYQMTPLHARCPTYLLRGGSSSIEKATGTVSVALDDLIVAGTTIVSIRAPVE